MIQRLFWKILSKKILIEINKNYLLHFKINIFTILFSFILKSILKFIFIYYYKMKSLIFFNLLPSLF